MDILFQTIADLLNSLIPSGSLLSLELTSLNEFLAYALTLSIIYGFFIKPILKILRLNK